MMSAFENMLSHDQVVSAMVDFEKHFESIDGSAHEQELEYLADAARGLFADQTKPRDLWLEFIMHGSKICEEEREKTNPRPTAVLRALESFIEYNKPRPTNIKF